MTGDKDIKIPSITAGTVPSSGESGLGQVLGLLLKSGEKVHPFGNDKTISDVITLSAAGDAKTGLPVAQKPSKPKAGNKVIKK